ncbi:tigger transposable element-derived protein 1-like [Macrobrachium nipponense]|uniref:tigger transposable element-derived protein 1-like n=1 Tax=Macrobrachium nipponense TaxID=159736 RepID=UPI0030C882A6
MAMPEGPMGRKFHTQWHRSLSGVFSWLGLQQCTKALQPQSSLAFTHKVMVAGVVIHYMDRYPSISTILKQKEAIKAATPSKGVNFLSNKRSHVHDEMEKLLLVRIKDKEIAGDTITETAICQKAGTIFGDLIAQADTTSTPDFKASRGWFDKFRRWTGIQSVVRHGEAASSDTKAAQAFIKTFNEMTINEDYSSQNVFNCDETGLLWKKMPRQTYIMEEEKKLPGHKPMKDRLTLALCSNDSGVWKVKPLLVYHSETPRAFKAHKEHQEELTTDDLKELEAMQHNVFQEVL